MKRSDKLEIINDTLLSWEAGETLSRQLRDLVSAFRGWVEYGAISRDGLSNSEYDSIPNLYNWLCDTISNTSNKVDVTNAAKRAAACLGLKNLFERYVRSLQKARPDDVAPASADPAPIASPITITVTNITPESAPAQPAAAQPAAAQPAAAQSAAAQSAAAQPAPAQEETILPAQELPPPTESPIPSNYIATKNMLNYMTDKMLLLSEEDRIYAIIRKYEYLLDKDDFMAYDAEVRNNANVYLDMTITMFPIPPHLYQQLILVRTYLMHMMQRLPENKYYRRMQL